MPLLLKVLEDWHLLSNLAMWSHVQYRQRWHAHVVVHDVLQIAPPLVHGIRFSKSDG